MDAKTMSGKDHQRDQMVERHIKGRGIRNPLVLAAMRAVRRELFVPKNLRNEAYDDAPLPPGADAVIMV